VKRVALLGATGSIGRQAIEIVNADPELELCAAASGSSPLDAVDAPLKQVGGDLTELLERAQPQDLPLGLGVQKLLGRHSPLAGMGATCTREQGEPRCGGDPYRSAERGGGGTRRSTASTRRSTSYKASADQAASLVLTGSGGPFRGRNRDELASVRPEQALAHPTWHMGPKITVDSATLANKGLELIEAHFLFGIPYAQIEVVIQSTSIVHSLVRFRDGAMLAHMGYPDMRVPSPMRSLPERAETLFSARLL
jgi:1-deoxy-D-xylulose-5-phosphate reductoisomerase